MYYRNKVSGTVSMLSNEPMCLEQHEDTTWVKCVACFNAL